MKGILSTQIRELQELPKGVNEKLAINGLIASDYSGGINGVAKAVAIIK